MLTQASKNGLPTGYPIRECTCEYSLPRALFMVREFQGIFPKRNFISPSKDFILFGLINFEVLFAA